MGIVWSQLKLSFDECRNSNFPERNRSRRIFPFSQHLKRLKIWGSGSILLNIIYMAYCMQHTLCRIHMYFKRTIESHSCPLNLWTNKTYAAYDMPYIFSDVDWYWFILRLSWHAYQILPNKKHLYMEQSFHLRFVVDQFLDHSFLRFEKYSIIFKRNIIFGFVFC